MKRYLPSLWVLALALLLAACRPPEAEPPFPPEPEGIIHLESLSVEIPRSGLSPQVLAQAVQELPEALKAALAEQGVEVETVTVSVGSSPAATAQAVAEGGVDLAFFAADDFTALEAPPEVILAAGPLSSTESFDEVSGTPRPGVCVLICSAPTDYGEGLMEPGGRALTWEEVSQARWGLLEEGNLLGRGAVDLWLWDDYGKTTADLEHVTVCDSCETLLRAAAAEEIDLLPLWDGVGQEWAEAWTLDASKTDSRGVRGLGRPAPFRDELTRLAVTSRFYTAVAAARSDSGVLTEIPFQTALAEAVNGFGPDNPVFGPYPYTVAVAGDLDAQRRLAGLRG